MNDLSNFAERMDRCWIENRCDDLAEYFAENIVVVVPDGKTRLEGRVAAIESYRGFVSGVSIQHFGASSPHVTVCGNTAVIEYGWQIDWISVGKTYHARGDEVLVLNREGSEWRVIWRKQSASE